MFRESDRIQGKVGGRDGAVPDFPPNLSVGGFNRSTEIVPLLVPYPFGSGFPFGLGRSQGRAHFRESMTKISRILAVVQPTFDTMLDALVFVKKADVFLVERDKGRIGLRLVCATTGIGGGTEGGSDLQSLDKLGVGSIYELLFVVVVDATQKRGNVAVHSREGEIACIAKLIPVNTVGFPFRRRVIHLRRHL